MKNKIQQLIGQNQTEDAIALLFKYAKGQHSDDLTILQSKFEKLKRENRLYLASRNELSTDYNQLNDSLLQMIKVIFNSKNETNIVESSTKKWWKWIGSFGLIISILAGIAEFSGYSLKDWFSSESMDSNSVTVLVHGKKGKDDLVLPNRGIVKLAYGDAIISKQINNEGLITFNQISDVFFELQNGVEIWFEDPEGEPYRAVYNDSLYRLKRGQYINLEVELLGMEKIFGIVKSFTTGAPIDNAIIRVKGEETRTNQYGEFNLAIPEEKQQKFITVRVYKEGFSSWEVNNIPTTTNQEMSILLKKAKK